jgi:hypothetical protein
MKARTRLGRAAPARRAALMAQFPALRAAAQWDRPPLIYRDEAHLHQAVDPG